LVDKLVEIEYKLDLLNGDYGDFYSYCIYCGTKEYNGKVGLVHSKTCTIQKIRDKIKEIK